MALTHSTALNCPSVTFLTLVLIHIFLFPSFVHPLVAIIVCVSPLTWQNYLEANLPVFGSSGKPRSSYFLTFTRTFSHCVLAVLFRTPAFRESKRSVPASVLTVEPS
ncbi:hypothetical protein CBS63078_7355 [Aspergillus niger]|nr:hypothetical protein CBS115989_777 [Aspergillus niger]KAI2825519.1 hypothetical protein CBS133816_8380 [Aspergillus niger]KAI2834797.1 hypothetical protein CBS11232_10714 [Aspergillus niger]KAI2839260.1 hypothetical protein CBS12448_10766 [Aspergillus niger]KAI2842657.1 hypothetical protein CBS11350_5625 [Aspergillus niger]